MAVRESGRRGIKDVFYETRVLMGRDYTLRRFAEEQLGSSIDPVMLGYIETGRRFPGEALVRRLAVVRKQDAHELLALLWRDRMLHAFGKELRRALNAPRAVAGVEDAELAVLVSQAIAALPDDGTWISAQTWRRAFAQSPRRRKGAPPASATAVKQIESILTKQELVELRGGKVRRRGRHFVASDTEQRQALALEFCALFAKGLLDKLALGERETGTYLRNHYLNIESDRLPEFQARLDRELRKLTEEFAADASARTDLLNVLVTSTKL